MVFSLCSLFALASFMLALIGLKKFRSFQKPSRIARAFDVRCSLLWARHCFIGWSADEKKILLGAFEDDMYHQHRSVILISISISISIPVSVLVLVLIIIPVISAWGGRSGVRAWVYKVGLALLALLFSVFFLVLFPFLSCLFFLAFLAEVGRSITPF